MAAIRVGMIGGDLHALYYGAQMFDHDPLHLRSLGRGYAAAFYHYTHYNDPRTMTVPFVGGFELAKVWAAERDDAEVMASVFGGEVCDSFEQCSDGVDLVFIPDCNGDGADHLELASPGLEKRVPTFCDKPFAYEYRDARALVELAEQTGTPLMSLSILREVPQGGHFRSRLAEIAPVGFACIKGGGTSMAGHIHAISLAQSIFGPGVEAVEAMGPAELSFVHLVYGEGRDQFQPEAGVMLNCDSGPTYHCSFYVSAFSALGPIHSPQIGDFEFPWGSASVLRKVQAMVATGQPQAPYAEMLECIAIATAGRLAQDRGDRVLLAEVRGS